MPAVLRPNLWPATINTTVLTVSSAPASGQLAEGTILFGFGGSWDTTSSPVHTNTIGGSGFGGTWTMLSDFAFDTGAALNKPSVAMAYMINGRRDSATQFITNTKNGTSASETVAGAEFEGLRRVSPIIQTITGRGSSNSPSISITPAVPSLVIAIVGYNTGGPTTITATGATFTQLVEADETNTAQAFNVVYATGVTGAVTATWTLGASCEWGCIIVAFEEETETPDFSRFPRRFKQPLSS